MADDCLHFAEQERARLNTEIEVLQEKIRLHGETKDAWNTIVRNAEGESDTACLGLADSAKERLDRKIEAAQQKIRLHNETKDAWDRIEHNAENESRIYQATTYERGKDGHWHVQRLNLEIEVLQEEIGLYIECKNAWDTLVRNAGNELQATYLGYANAGKEQLDGKIEAAQEKISRRIEIREAWETILRIADSELRIYQGAAYVMGVDRQWHLQRAEAGASNAKGAEPKGDDEQKIDAVSKRHSMWQLFLGTHKRTLHEPERNIDLSVQGKEQFLSLGLR